MVAVLCTWTTGEKMTKQYEMSVISQSIRKFPQILPFPTLHATDSSPGHQIGGTTYQASPSHSSCLCRFILQQPPARLKTDANLARNGPHAEALLPQCQHLGDKCGVGDFIRLATPQLARIVGPRPS